MLTTLIPKIFFDRMEDGLALFEGCLGFKVLHNDGELAVLERDGLKAYVVQDAEYASKDRPEIAIETDDIEAMFREVSSRRPEMLHPNGRTITAKPWGCREFAVLDRTHVCIVFRQW